MRRTIILLFFITILVVFSCHKKEETAFSEEFPEWLQVKISEVITDQNLCKITSVYYIEYNNQRYYNLYCALWSCAYCQFFDEQGNRPNWDSSGWNDFFAKMKIVQTIPACQ